MTTYMKKLALITCLGIASGALAMDHVVEPRKPVPLKNIGSSCFMNAAIQVAYAMHDVTSLLLEQSDVYKEDTLAKAYVDLLPFFMFSDIDKDGIDPSTFCFLGWNQVQSDPFKQADANEFLVELLRCLTYKDVGDTHWPRLGRHIGPLELITDLSRLFYVRTASKAYAHLGDMGTFEAKPRVEPVPCLMLPVQENSMSLADCLRSYFQPVGENVRTPAGLVEGERHTFLEGTHKYFICSLDRRGFAARAEDSDEEQPTYTRNENPISFDLYNQSFDEFLQDKDKAEGFYEIIGIIMHSGSANCGHYTAYVKSGNQWYYCNDEKITALDETDVIELATRGYGVNQNTLPTTLLFECKRTRARYPLVDPIPPKAPSPVQSRPPAPAPKKAVVKKSVLKRSAAGKKK